MAVCLICMAACSSVRDEKATVSTNVSGYCLTLDKTTGSVVSFGRDGNLLASCGEPLFIIRFRDDDGTPVRYTAADAGKCSVAKKEKNLTFE